MNKEELLTKEGLEKTIGEYEHLVSVKRKEVEERIKEAREHGDLSENAEYDAALQEQAELEALIKKLDERIRYAKIIGEDELDTDKVNVGHTVTVVRDGSDKELQYTILGSAEADPINGKISNESALGKALIGCHAGDVVEVELPKTKTKYTVIKFEKF